MSKRDTPDRPSPGARRLWFLLCSLLILGTVYLVRDTFWIFLGIALASLVVSLWRGMRRR